MNIKSLLKTTLGLAFLSSEAQAQDFWWAYMASYDEGAGSIRVNLGLKDIAPVHQYQQLVITGVTYKSNNSDGLPNAETIDRLNALSEKIISSIEKTSPCIYAGTFTYNNEQLHYIYVKDASKVKSTLNDLYRKVCMNCKTYINIKPDPSWSAYNDFLHPNQATINFYQAELRNIYPSILKSQ